ncbi:MAG TPA: septum formation initiator family protein [Candidatus Cloacimonadota bacterium]|nr:septum formation initiator family protein [Candidatus Cloacimonadota bacterium]
MKLRKKDLIFYGIIILFLCYIFFFDGYGFLKRYRTGKELSKARNTLSELQKENERLRLENEKLEHDKQIWEKRAREIGMQRKGDEVYQFKKVQKEK